MKLHTLIKTLAITASIAITALMPASAAAIAPGSIPYNGGGTNGPEFPAFNIYNNVPSVGNEADFIRLKKDGAANSTLTSSLNTTCNTGDRFVVWFYVHNGATDNLNDNGNGPTVAKNVVAKVNLPTGAQHSFNVTGGLTASNADAVNDNAMLNCGTSSFKLKYVADSAGAFLDQSNTNVTLSNSIVTDGAPIGTVAAGNSVWGCWEQRVWIALKVEVEEVTPVYSCDLMTVIKLSDNKFRFTVNYTAENGSVFNNVTYNFGDGKTVTTGTTVTHTFAKSSHVTATANFTVDGDPQSDTAESCKKTVNLKPHELPNTGAGNILAIFAATSAIGAFLYRNKLIRRSR